MIIVLQLKTEKLTSFVIDCQLAPLRLFLDFPMIFSLHPRLISDTRVQFVVEHLEKYALSQNLCFWFDFVFKQKPKDFVSS